MPESGFLDPRYIGKVVRTNSTYPRWRGSDSSEMFKFEEAGFGFTISDILLLWNG